MLQVSIIIVTYNTLGITRQCIDSIYGHTEGVDFEVIVIDNASSDGTRQVLENDSRIRYIYSSENLGFGRANNLGMQKAKGEYLFLLNSDTLLLNNAVRILYEAAESYTGKLGVMGTILLDRRQQPTHSFGRFITICNSLSDPFERIYCRLTHKKSEIYNPEIPESPVKVEYVSGADMFLPKPVFEITGGFDSDFFMYAEDAEWQYRMAKAGYDRVIIPEPRIIHLEGASDASTRREWSYTRLYNAMSSRMIYIRKHYSRAAYTAFRIAYAAVRIPTIIAAGYSGRQKLSLLKLLTVKNL